MLGGDDDDEPFPGKNARVHAFRGCTVGQPEHCHVHTALADRGDELIATAASELDPHRRVGAMEVPERSGYIDGGYRRNHTDGETASNLPVRLRRLGDRPFSCIETLSCSC